MKKLKLLLLSGLSLLLFLWPPKSIRSCGFFLYMEEYRFWNFDPELGNESGLQSLFYSMDYSHQGFGNRYDYEIEEPEINGEYESNIQSWIAYCKGIDPNATILSDDVSKILYETEPVDYFKIRKGLMEENTFLRFLSAHPKALEYVEFAKKSEYQSNIHNTWNCPDCPQLIAPGKVIASENKYHYYDYEVSPDPINGISSIERGKELLNQCRDSFLKQRYGYQIVRMAYYNYDSSDLISTYQKYLEPLPDNSWLKLNARMYEVMFHDGAEKNLGLSKIFDICPDKRYRCEELFKDALFEPTKELASNNHEKAMVQVMHTLQKPDEQLESIQEIIRLEPNNKFLPFLWVREINKLEDWILSSKVTEFGSTRNEMLEDYEDITLHEKSKQFITDKAYAANVLKAIENILEKGNEGHGSFYHLCAGYIAFMLQDLSLAQQHYAQVKQAELNEGGKTQFLINRYMLALSQTQQITPELENTLVDCIKHLQLRSNKKPQYRRMVYQLINFSAAEFRRRGAIAKGLMLYGKSSQPYAMHPLIGIANVYTQVYTHATPTTIDSILWMLNKTNPSPLEQYIKGKVFEYTYEYERDMKDWSEDQLLDIKSMKLVQQDQLLAAYQTVCKIDTSYWSNEVNSMFRKDDPFCLNPWNGHDPMNYRGVSYNKKTFLKEWISLKTKMAKASGEEKARLLLKIGNAYYSTTYWGKFWIMQKNYHMGYDPQSKYFDVDPAYYSAARAKYYYHQVIKTSKDPKLLGATLYILNTAFENTNASLEKNRNLLMSNTKAEDYYLQLSGNCDLFYDFIKTYN